MTDFEKLVKEAAAEGKQLVDETCEPHGFWLWKKNTHKWGKWYREFQKTCNSDGSILGHYYERSCKHCGNVQRKYIKF